MAQKASEIEEKILALDKIGISMVLSPCLVPGLDIFMDKVMALSSFSLLVLAVLIDPKMALFRALGFLESRSMNFYMMATFCWRSLLVLKVSMTLLFFSELEFEVSDWLRPSFLYSYEI